jgi:hypothetical protein
MNILKEIKAIRYEDFIKENFIEVELLSRRQLEELDAIKWELEEQEKKYGILYYKPQLYQEGFHKSKKKKRLVIGGNQTGKAEVGAAEILRASLGIDPHKKYEEWGEGAIRSRIIATDLAKGIGEVIMPKLKKLMPMSEVSRIVPARVLA